MSPYKQGLMSDQMWDQMWRAGVSVSVLTTRNAAPRDALSVSDASHSTVPCSLFHIHPKQRWPIVSIFLSHPVRIGMSRYRMTGRKGPKEGTLAYLGRTFHMTRMA